MLGSYGHYSNEIDIEEVDTIRFSYWPVEMRILPSTVTIRTMIRTDRRYFLTISAFVMVLITLPSILASQGAGTEHVFGGVLLNPLDGWSYIAKAYQGWMGEWKITLPYTAEPGDGAYIHLYYVFLGHASRLLDISIPRVLNASRVINTALLLIALWRFFSKQFSKRREIRTAFSISAIALGMGWLLLFFGKVPSDFWVAEAYPLLAGLTNAHFPLGLAIILVLATPVELRGPQLFLRNFLLALLLALVSPFGVFIAVLPWAGLLLLEFIRITKASDESIRKVFAHPGLLHLAGILLGGLPIIIYELAAILSDPVLSAWNDQNITITPAWWDLALSFSPGLILAIIGIRKAPKTLLVWGAMGLVLIFVPHPLQRRFLMGFQIPIAGLAASGWIRLTENKQKLARLVLLFCFIPSPVILFFSIQTGVASRNPLLYLSASEVAAVEWIALETGQDDLILASPEMGLFIPALSGRKVIYGHPFETVQAEFEKNAVEAFFSGEDGGVNSGFLEKREVDYVFYGTREQSFGNFDPGFNLESVYDNDEVRIFRVLR